VSTETAKKPSVLFVCVHNAGRSQMAAAFLTTLAKGNIEVRSAEIPKVLTTEAVKESDVVITMGCGDECPYFPGKRYEDWVLEDPAGQGVDAVRPIRDEIKTRIEGLIESLIPAAK
jgi:arsenate reductase